MTAPALSSRPNAATAIYLNCDGGSGTWNNRAWTAPAFTGNVATLYEVVRKAWAPFLVNVTTVKPTGKCLTIVVGIAFGNYPGGGESNIGSFDNDVNPTSFVFADRVGSDPVSCGWLAAHESGHAVGGFNDDITITADNPVGIYTPGRIMGNCLMQTPVPIWTPDQRIQLGTRFGWSGDIDGNGTVNFTDITTGRDAHDSIPEILAAVRNMTAGK